MMMRFFYPFIMLFACCRPTLGFAEEQSKNPAFTPAINTGALLQTLLGLILVLAVIALIALILRHNTRFTSANNGKIKILASLPFGTRERAVLIQVGQQQILLGVTQQQISTLLVLEHNIHDQEAEKTMPDFAERLKHFLQQKEK